MNFLRWQVVGLSGLVCFLAGSLSVNAQSDRFADVVVDTAALGNSVFMLTGAGGNLAVSAGPDGLLLVDDQFAALAERIEAALVALPDPAPLSERPLKYVINTHHHGDHTGGNDYFAGLGATLVASDAARVRLLARAPSPDTPLPVITYDAGISIYFNGDRLRLVAMQGHTDGDTAVLFERANVLHAGDLFFNGRFPYIDLDSGGGVSDYLNSQERMLALIDNDTRVVPGHGPLASKQDLLDTYQMIKTTRAAVKADVASGLSLTAIQEKGVSPVYKRFAWNFITEARWLELLYLDVAATGPGA
jgi:glyoxylase-like metal-dependent hydrolase (beta-lactamase superfamily II)